MQAALLGVGQGRLVLAVGIGFWVLTSACSGSKRSSAGTADAGERCYSPGVTMTGCFCSADQPSGLHKCGANMTWSPCICPPPQKADKCIQGQTVTCGLCPGESVGRMTTCLQDGTLDCACAGPTDGGSGLAGKGARDTDGG